MSLHCEICDWKNTSTFEEFTGRDLKFTINVVLTIERSKPIVKLTILQ